MNVLTEESAQGLLNRLQLDREEKVHHRPRKDLEERHELGTAQKNLKESKLNNLDIADSSCRQASRETTQMTGRPWMSHKGVSES
jgi:hypothetical protein